MFLCRPDHRRIGAVESCQRDAGPLIDVPMNFGIAARQVSPCEVAGGDGFGREEDPRLHLSIVRWPAARQALWITPCECTLLYALAEKGGQ